VRLSGQDGRKAWRQHSFLAFGGGFFIIILIVGLVNAEVWTRWCGVVVGEGWGNTRQRKKSILFFFFFFSFFARQKKKKKQPSNQP
jgi:hypothetical protein